MRQAGGTLLWACEGQRREAGSCNCGLLCLYSPWDLFYVYVKPKRILKIGFFFYEGSKGSIGIFMLKLWFSEFSDLLIAPLHLFQVLQVSGAAEMELRVVF